MILAALMLVGCKDKCRHSNSSESICTTSGAVTTCVYKCNGHLTETSSAPEPTTDGK